VLENLTGPWACAKRNEIRRLLLLERERRALGDLEGAKAAGEKARRMRSFYEAVKPPRKRRKAEPRPEDPALAPEREELMALLTAREREGRGAVRYWQLIDGAAKRAGARGKAEMKRVRLRYMSALGELLRAGRAVRVCRRFVLSVGAISATGR
jgi:hypothetical protein